PGSPRICVLVLLSQVFFAGGETGRCHSGCDLSAPGSALRSAQRELSDRETLALTGSDRRSLRTCTLCGLSKGRFGKSRSAAPSSAATVDRIQCRDLLQDFLVRLRFGAGILGFFHLLQDVAHDCRPLAVGGKLFLPFRKRLPCQTC